MSTSNGTPNGSDKPTHHLEALRQRRQRVQRELDRVRKREQELLARERLEASPHFTQLTDQMASLRKTLHRIRINIARKRLSITSLNKKLRGREQEIANLALEEQEHVAQLDRIERQLEQARLKVLEQLQPTRQSA